MEALGRTFPFRDVFTSFLEDYAKSATYWYVPKARVLNDENVEVMANIIKLIFDEYLGRIWNVETQDIILRRLVKDKIVEPYKSEGTQADRVALIRIWKKLLETLGLLLVQEDKEIVITDAGLDLIGGSAEERRQVIERQIIRYQYPNPSLAGTYAEGFTGLLPHIFLLQLLKVCDNRITSIEYELFVNLAKSQEDIDRVSRYMLSWRDIGEREKQVIFDRVMPVVMTETEFEEESTAETATEEGPTRFNRIHLNAGYQKSFFVFPRYVKILKDEIVCTAPDKSDQLLNKVLPSLKITEFRTLED